MNNKPILILQMQRMGDLVLTFPLLLWLQQLYPTHPIWVFAEQSFFEGLMPLSPQVTYFPREAAALLAKESYSLVINLSHRPEAATLAGQVDCEQVIGLTTDSNGVSHIHGNWQLYRASLVHNNRHNLFHWADLNGLDAVPLDLIRTTQWPAPNTERQDASRIGLFLGASDAAKRPSVAFWTKLVTSLLNRGLKPVLLGGKADMALGYAVAQNASVPALNLCGRFSLAEFVALTRTLRCMITPDTGPMHVATWTETPVLNLSMGYVHPWETGPYQPGHFALRSSISCTGCWQCKHPTLRCHASFSADRIAALAHALTRHDSKSLQITPAGQKLLISGRDMQGLYDLSFADGTPDNSPRKLFASFWKAFFGSELGLWPDNSAQTAWNTLHDATPQSMPLMRNELLKLSRDILMALKGKNSPATHPDFWIAHPPFIRPLTGYLHLLLQNNEFSSKGYADSLKMIENIINLSAR